ncbi:MAG: restriction endonuclease subunit S [Pseudomonadota bacterium]
MNQHYPFTLSLSKGKTLRGFDKLSPNGLEVMMNKAGWQTKNLGDVCDVVGGGTPSKGKPAFYSGDIPWATVRDIKQEVISSTEFKITKEAVKSSATNIIPSGNVVIATRVGLGKVCLLGQDTAINQDLRGIVPHDTTKLDVRFLYWWLKSIADVIVAEGTGATVQGVKLPFVKSLQVPFPPLPEQQRIVGILDAAFDGIATAKANAEQNLQNARALFESHLQSVFTQRGEGWVVKKVSEVAKHSLGKMLDKAKNKGELQPYLRNINVRWFNFDLSDLIQMPFLPSESDKYTAVKGDVLICEGGYPGRAAIWNEDYPVYFQKALHRVRFHEPEHNKWFLYYLYVQDMSGELKQHFSGTGIQHFTGEVLARFEIPLPPLQELRKAVTKFDELAEKTQRLESLCQRKLAALAELKKSLLHQAFTGAL